MPSSRADAPSPTTAVTWSEVLEGTAAGDDPEILPDAGSARPRRVRCRLPGPDTARRASRLLVGLACFVGLVGVARPELLEPLTAHPGVAAASPTDAVGAAGGAIDGATPAVGSGEPGAGLATPSDLPAPSGTSNGASGRDGTVPVTGAPPDGRADRAIAFAMAQRGVPYVWGGDGPAEGGYDCSGLTKAAYGSAQVVLTRTAQAQFDAGPHVTDPASPAPGDLVFYGTPSRVHHVGLYLGNGLMVHAPHSGTVVQVGRYRWPGDDYVGASRPAAPGSAVGPGDAASVVVPPSSSSGGAGSDPAPEGPAVSEPDPVEPAAPRVAPVPLGVVPAPASGAPLAVSSAPAPVPVITSRAPAPGSTRSSTASSSRVIPPRATPPAAPAAPPAAASSSAAPTVATAPSGEPSAAPAGGSAVGVLPAVVPTTTTTTPLPPALR